MLKTATAMAIIALLCASCRTATDWNPFVELDNYRTITVLDFSDDGSGIGTELSDQLASELVRSGAFDQVLRKRVGDPSIVVGGRVKRFSKGNVAARIKYGPAIGQATLRLDVQIAVDPGDEFVGELEIDENTRTFGPDAGRTGREDATWLRQHVVEQLAQTIVAQAR